MAYYLSPPPQDMPIIKQDWNITRWYIYKRHHKELTNDIYFNKSVIFPR